MRANASNKDAVLKLDVASTRVEPYFTPINPENGLPILPFTQISDHYGISCDINYSDI